MLQVVGKALHSGLQKNTGILPRSRRTPSVEFTRTV
jgi:hypothetical protein